ncbi:MAG: MBOAT family protein [Methylococcales bacterium]|nr:MBOAT family protein [Methylococcales bacterium]MDD5630676.1 MBOAT family protein [Methylococcales bacterium]
MLFDTLQYWIFFATVLAIYGSLGVRSGRGFLVFVSFVFYGFWELKFLILLAGSTAFNYFSGIAIESAPENRRRIWLILSISGNLLVLGFFKYYNFFVESFAQLFGLDLDSFILNIILPVGVSFFTFEGVAYNVDVYHKKVQARRNLLDFALFLSFFPHLVAGPIIRPHDFFPQVGPKWRIDAVDFKWGMMQIIKGLIKKCVFADVFAVHANTYFAQTAASGQITALIGVLSFGMQIYFDFAGYTDIARGCARLLGFKFPPNFERPYLTSDISEFWRKWHISLSTWLRDYLYIPLGGNRKGMLNTYRNYLIVMGLGGLWHGASWNFLIWGLFHGCLLSAHRLWLDFGPAKIRSWMQHNLGAVFGWMLTMILVFIGWIPFRATDWHQTTRIFADLLTPGTYNLTSIPTELLVLTGISLAYCLLDHKRWLEQWIESRITLLHFSITAGFALWFLSLFMQRNSAIPFLYFQF